VRHRFSGILPPDGNSRSRLSRVRTSYEYDGLSRRSSSRSGGLSGRRCLRGYRRAGRFRLPVVAADSRGTIVEEFGVSPEASVDGDFDVEVTPIQSNDREAIYRFERDEATDCACEIVETTGTPVSSVRAQDGELLLVSHARIYRGRRDRRRVAGAFRRRSGRRTRRTTMRFPPIRSSSTEMNSRLASGEIKRRPTRWATSTIKGRERDRRGRGTRRRPIDLHRAPRGRTDEADGCDPRGGPRPAVSFV